MAKKQLTDFGQKIGGARKDMFKQHLDVRVFDSLEEQEKQKMARKSILWPLPDYRKMITEKGEDITYLTKCFRDSLRSVPKSYSRTDRTNFVKIASLFRSFCENDLDGETPEELAQEILHFWRENRLVELSVQTGYTSVKYWHDTYDAYKSTYKPALDQLHTSWYEFHKQEFVKGLNTIKKRPTKKKKENFVYAPMGVVSRKGPSHHTGNIAPRAVLEVGFRGVEFGNWMPQNERQAHLDKAYEAFRDIADVLDIDYHDISLGGDLALAFGARGHSSALAHYEPGLNVINLTRMKGAGNLAHEWAHAFDTWVCSWMIPSRNSQYSANVRKNDSHTEPQNTQEVFENLVYLMLTTVKDGRVTESQYLADSKLVDKQYNHNGHGYWANTEEMFARAFACYVADKLESIGRRNDYLCGYARPSDGFPVPKGEELERLNKAFDELFFILKKSGHLHKPIQEEPKSYGYDTGIEMVQESYEQIALF